MGVFRVEEQSNLDLFEDGILASDHGLEQLITDLQDANGGDH